MNSPQSEVLTPPPVEVDAGPGQRLRSAREAASLSIEEVAARLHLDTRTIKNLETDNYEGLPAPTFVRGYLRNYARLLNIQPEPLIDGFDRRGLQPPALIADISTSEEAKSTDAPMRLATYGIALVLLAGVVIWGQSQFGSGWSEGGEEVPEQLGDAPLVPELRSGAGDSAETLLPALPGLRESGDLPLRPAGSDAAAGASLLPAEPQPVQLPDSPAAAASDSPPSAAGGDTAAAETTPAAQPAVPGVAHLVLRARRDSWIEVYDRDGVQLYYDTARAGDSIDLRAAEPLRVLIGFARGVQVEYNGEVFDTTPHMARGVARFSLGGG